MIVEAPKAKNEAWLDAVDAFIAEKGVQDLDDPEQRRVFFKDRKHFKYSEHKASPEAKAKAATDNKQALSNLETGKAKLTLPNTRQQAIEKAVLISKGAKPPASETKPTIRKIRTVQESEKPQAEILDKPKTPSKPLESVKDTNTPKEDLKATERKITAQNKPFASEGLSVKEKQGLLLERTLFRFRCDDIDFDGLIAEVINIKNMALVDAYLSFEAIATANNTTIEEIIKAGKRYG